MKLKVEVFGEKYEMIILKLQELALILIRLIRKTSKLT